MMNFSPVLLILKSVDVFDFEFLFDDRKLVFHIVADDADCREGREVGEKFDAESEKVVFAITRTRHNRPDGNTFGEHRRVAACHNRVAFHKLGVLGQLFEYRLARIATVPDERTDLIFTLDLTRQAQVGIQHGNQASGVIADDVDNADNTVLVDDTHLRLDSVKPTLLDRDVIVRPIDRIVDHMSNQEVVARQHGVDRHRVGIEFLLIVTDDAFETVIFKFEIGISMLKILIDVAQREVGGHVARRPIDTRRDCICRRQIDMMLKRIAREQHRKPCHHIEDKQKPRTVFNEKL